MENLIVYYLFLTLFASMVGNRAAKLKRNSWSWGISAWLISPLFVWIALEICGRKKDKPDAQTMEEVVEHQNLPLQENNLV